jgi:hypothetical protein
MKKNNNKFKTLIKKSKFLTNSYLAVKYIVKLGDDFKFKSLKNFGADLQRYSATSNNLEVNYEVLSELAP